MGGSLPESLAALRGVYTLDSIAHNGGWSSKALLGDDLGRLLLLRGSQERKEPLSSTSMQRPCILCLEILHVCEKPAPT